MSHDHTAHRPHCSITSDLHWTRLPGCRAPRGSCLTCCWPRPLSHWPTIGASWAQVTRHPGQESQEESPVTREHSESSLSLSLSRSPVMSAVHCSLHQGQGCKYFRKCPRLFDRDTGHMCFMITITGHSAAAPDSWWWLCHACDHRASVFPRVMIHNWSGDWELLAQDPARQRHGEQELRKLARPGLPSCTLRYAHMPSSSCSDWRTQCDNRFWLVQSRWSCTDEPISPQILEAYDLIGDGAGRSRELTMASVGPRSPAGASGHRTRPGHLPWEILPLLESGNTETETDTETGHAALSETIIIPNGSQSSPCQCINELISPPQ